jgi:hypothetical protein
MIAHFADQPRLSNVQGRYTGSENDIEIDMAKQLPAMMRAKYLLMAIIPLLV